MNPIDVVKSNLGSITGLGGSKKYALTTLFVAFCLFLLESETSPAVRIALLAASAVALSSYVIGQSIVEAHGVRSVDSEPVEKKAPRK